MKDFLKAATPWILTGLGIALCAVRGARGRRGGEEGARDYTGELCAGVCLGAAAGFLAGWNLSLSIVMGMLLCAGSGLGFLRGRRESGEPCPFQGGGAESTEMK